MKRLSTLLLAALTSVYGFAVDYMMYTGIYGECEDDEPSQIYGGSYSEYPPGLNDAQFPGGEVELSIYLSRNTDIQEVYSGEYDKNGVPLLVTGEVLVEFVIDRCGKPGKFRILQSLTDEQDAEALRVMETLPMFRAASLDGYRVKSAYIAPIRFLHDRMPKPKEDEYYYDDTSYDYNYDSSSDYNYDYSSDYNDYNYDYNSDYSSESDSIYNQEYTSESDTIKHNQDNSAKSDSTYKHNEGNVY